MLTKNKGFYLENLFVLECETMDDIMAVFEEGETISLEKFLVNK